MWIMTKFGLFSIVQNNDNPQTLLIRARAREHLTELMEATHKSGVRARKITTTPERDYPFRIVVNRREFAGMLTRLAGAITYGNFKGETDRYRGFDWYARALHSVWAVMEAAAEHVRPSGKGGRRALFR